MNSIKQIIEDFEHGDDEQRLFLFLIHRDLRSEFMEITNKPRRAAVSKKKEKKATAIQIEPVLEYN